MSALKTAAAKRRRALVSNRLAEDLMAAARDMLRAAKRGDKTGIADALTLSAAIDDFQALQAQTLFSCPVAVTLESLLRPVIADWESGAHMSSHSFSAMLPPRDKVAVDAPLMRQAFKLMGIQARAHAGEGGTVRLGFSRLMMPARVEVSLRSARGPARPAPHSGPYQAFSDLFCDDVVGLFGGSYSLIASDKRRTMRVTLPLHVSR